MCKMCDWYDHMIFGENAIESGDIFGLRKGMNDLMSHWDTKNWD